MRGKPKKLRNNIKVEDRLIALGKSKEKKILQKVAEKSFRERKIINNKTNNNQNYSFVPKINDYPIIRNKSQDIYNRLYNQKDNHKKKMKKLDYIYFKEKYKFTPEINKITKEKLKNRLKTNNYKSNKKLFKKDKPKKNEIINNKRNIVAANSNKHKNGKSNNK